MANNKDFKVKNGIKPTVYHEGVGTVVSGSEAYSLSSASYDSVSFSAASQDATILHNFFKPDGTVMYLIGQTNDTIFQYTLSTAWDVSTASYASKSLSVNAQDANVGGFWFKTDGTKVYFVGFAGDNVYQYSLSTAWDISTASYDSVSFNVNTQDTTPLAVIFSDDGTNMYVTGVTNKNIYQYSLSTAWDISTASYASKSFNTSSVETSPSCAAFAESGSTLFFMGTSSDSVYKASLSTAWDISTASLTGESFSVSSQEGGPHGLFFKPDGTKMYISGYGSDTVFQYSTVQTTASLDLSTGSVFEITPTSDVQVTLSNPAASGTVSAATLLLDGAVNPYDLSGAAYDSKSFSVAGQETTPRDVAFKSDGTKMYVIGATGDDVNEYSLSTAWDVSTASYTTVFSVSSQDATPTSIHFKPDGTSFYITGSNTDYAYQYTMSTAWDISTASYATDSLYLSATSPTAMSIYIKPDGTKVYTLSDGNDAVYQWTLSTAWDLSTGTYDSVSFSVASQAPNPWGMSFSSDGTKLFVSDYGYREVYQYSLSTAWDLSTASYDNVSFSVAGEDLFPYGITFKPDGLKMYVAGNYTDTIYQYTTGSAYTVTYDSTLQWGGGTAPDSPAANETDVLTFTTRDGGTTYQAAIAIDGAA